MNQPLLPVLNGENKNAPRGIETAQGRVHAVSSRDDGENKNAPRGIETRCVLRWRCKVDPIVKTPKVPFLKCISPLCEMVLTGS